MLLVPPVIETSVPVALVIVPPLAVNVAAGLSPVIWMPLLELLVDDTVANVASAEAGVGEVDRGAAGGVDGVGGAGDVDRAGAGRPCRPKPPSVVTARLPKAKLLVVPMPVERSMPLAVWPPAIALSVTVVACRS